MTRRHTALIVLFLVVGSGVVAPLSAQQDTLRRGVRLPDSTMNSGLLQASGASMSQSPAGVSHAEVVERLRQSGLTRDEAHDRLTEQGYDPAIVDPYFDVIDGGAEPPRGDASPGTLNALASIGIAVEPTGAVRAPSAPAAVPADSAEVNELEVFGRALFERATSQFQPVLAGPVGEDYRLGPGDELTLVLTGDVELFYTLPVSREGFILIPDVGQVSVNGLTLKELEDHLYDRLGRVYSGVRRGPDATTHFQVSLGRLGVNQVFVIGDVVRPSAYQVSSVATVLNALYRAGGPTEDGSFRHIVVRRGGRILRTIDLYDYLLYGDSRSDVRLEQGDIIFVPPAGPQVRVEGAVHRPAIYELAEGDDLRDAIGFAGGFEADAVVQRVQIDRILPPAERRPGVDRVLVDVDVTRFLGDTTAAFPLRDGDAVRVFAVSKQRRHRVVLTGDVRRPGLYQWSEGLTLWSLIAQAEGLTESAYTPRAHIYRLNETDGSRRLIRVPLPADSVRPEVADVVLADQDSVVILSRERLRTPALVSIDGFVKEPAVYPLAEGMTIADLILAAGGFVSGAYAVEAEVARLPAQLERSDTTAVIYRVPLGGAIAGDGTERTFGFGGAASDSNASMVPVWLPEPDEFVLRPGDRVFIRKAPGYELPAEIRLTGEVVWPGTYILETRQERLAHLIQRAGGLTEEAYPPGLQLFRGGTLVATDLPRALREPGSRWDLVLQPGDSVHVPEFDPTVRVTGAVAFESRILYEPGRGLDYYIERAGGYTDRADAGRTTVTYLDGERATVDRTLLFFRSTPEIRPGSTILVPTQPAGGGFDLDRFINRASGMALALLAVLAGVQQLKK
ncbi:MAG TPA: SLBB domain-containing protein [Longimicrobiales bacterium]